MTLDIQPLHNTDALVLHVRYFGALALCMIGMIIIR